MIFSMKFRKDVLKCIPEASAVYYMNKEHTEMRVYFAKYGRWDSEFVTIHVVELMNLVDKKGITGAAVKLFMLEYVKVRCKNKIEQARQIKENATAKLGKNTWADDLPEYMEEALPDIQDAWDNLGEEEQSDAE